MFSSELQAEARNLWSLGATILPIESWRSLACSCVEMCFWREARPEVALGGGAVSILFSLAYSVAAKR